MKNEDTIVRVLEEIRDNQTKQIDTVEKHLHAYEDYLKKQEEKYDQYLAKSRKAYNAHIRNVIIILIVALTFVFVIL